MKNIMQKLFLSCIKATELIEKRLHFKLSYNEKLKLKLHKMMCDACTRYEKQSIFLEKGMAGLKKKQEKVDIEKLKQVITQRLSK